MYMKWQTRVSKVPENNTFRLEGAGMLSFGSKVTEKERTYTSYQSYLLALGTTQISSFFTKHWTKFLTHQTGNYPVTWVVSKPSRITLVELSIINTSYQKLPLKRTLPFCRYLSSKLRVEYRTTCHYVCDKIPPIKLYCCPKSASLSE